MPLCHLAPGQARVEIYNSEFSEAAVMGFEYGFSATSPRHWSCGRRSLATSPTARKSSSTSSSSPVKTNGTSSLAWFCCFRMGMKVRGRTSSARIERYLQLCARDNMQVAQPSTAAQYSTFCVVRPCANGAHRSSCSPKKHVAASRSRCQPQPSSSRFPECPARRDRPRRERVLLCTGKIGHELRIERTKQKMSGPAIVMLEKCILSPKTISRGFGRYSNATEFIRVQEEPANMGALSFVAPRLKRVVGNKLRSIKRAANATPATGSTKAHELEQKTLITLALGQGL